MEAEVDDALWIAPAGADRVHIRLASHARKSTRSRVAHLCGVDDQPDDAKLMRAVSTAIGKDTMLGWTDLASVLGARGDKDVAKAINELDGSSETRNTDVNDFLRALKGHR